MAQFGPAVVLAESLANFEWGIPATGYLAYRAARAARENYLSTNNMPAQRKRPFGGAYVANKRKNVKKSFTFIGPVRRQPVPQYSSTQTISKMKRLFEKTATAVGTMSGVVRTDAIEGCPAWNRHLQTYEWCKLLGIKVHFTTNEPTKLPLLFTMVDFEGTTEQTVNDTYLKNPTFRKHELNGSQKNCRYINCQQLSHFKDWIKTDDFDAKANATLFATLSWKAPSVASGTELQYFVEYIMAFRGLKITVPQDSVVIQ